MAHPYFSLPRPLILGHRGAAGVAPENTLFAFERGLADGAHAIESDLHVTRDGVPVLIHDSSVDRTTEGKGSVEALDLGELQALDAGYRFQEDAVGAAAFRDRGIRVPSLREAFEAFPATAFNLEIKSAALDLVPAVVALVQEFEREDRTLLVAGEDGIQARLREELARSGARPALGASLADILDIVQAAGAGRPHATDSMAIQIPPKFGQEQLVTDALLQYCHAHDVQVHVWTINSESTMRELLDQGVDGLVTDVPGVMAALLPGLA